MAVQLGKGCRVDPGVVLGYPPERLDDPGPALIGDHARIRQGSVIYAATQIGRHLDTGHNVVIREENRIGDHFSIWNNSTVDYGCRIGQRVKVHSNVYLAQFTTLEDDVFLGPGVTCTNDPHPVCTMCMKGPVIKRGARIGGGVTLLPGVVVGEYSLVGAGSVVTSDIPDRTVAYGNPARPVGPVDELTCPLGKVGSPYQDGRDVLLRGLKD